MAECTKAAKTGQSLSKGMDYVLIKLIIAHANKEVAKDLILLFFERRG